MFDYINSFLSFSERRKTQILKEKEFDIKLQYVSHVCPETVFKYLWISREKSRKYSLEMYNSNVFNYIQTIEKNLNLIDSILFEIEKKDIISNIDICNTLKSLTETIEKI